jgi:hypothetical protein
MKPRGLLPNSWMVFVSDFFIPRIGRPFWLQRNRQNDPGNICVNRALVSFLGVHKAEPDIIYWILSGHSIAVLETCSERKKYLFCAKRGLREKIFYKEIKIKFLYILEG